MEIKDLIEIPTQEDLDLFPSLEEYKNLLKELRELDWTNSTVEEIYNGFYTRAKIMLQKLGTHNPERINGLRLFRVRMNIGKDEDDTLLRTYSYPPPIICNANGRANLKGTSVFYCSNRGYAALSEAKPKVGDIGHMSIWRINTPRTLRSIICLPFDLNSQNEWSISAKESDEFVKDHFRKYGGSKFDQLNLLNDFICSVFLDEKPPYSISSMLANRMLFHSKDKDFILYPSYAMKGTSCNLAFHPNTADLFIKFEKVIRFKVVEVKQDSYFISTGYVGELNHTKIQWRKANCAEETDFSKFEESE